MVFGKKEVNCIKKAPGVAWCRVFILSIGRGKLLFRSHFSFLGRFPKFGPVYSVVQITARVIAFQLLWRKLNFVCCITGMEID
jgi:hypothetical protein